MTDTIKDTLKKWKLLKTKEEYEFYHKIRPMTMLQKTALLGQEFMDEYVKIQTFNNEQEFIEHLSQIENYKLRIALGDTYLTIVNQQQIFF